MKLTEEDKREIIRCVQNGKTRKEMAQRYNIGVKHVENLIKKYAIHGEAAIVTGQRRKYSTAYKIEVVQQYLAGASKQKLSITHNVRYSRITDWIKKYEEGVYNEVKSKKEGDQASMSKRKKEKKVDKIEETVDKAKIRMLEKRNLELEAEIAYLKKLDALIQIREQRESKKK